MCSELGLGLLAVVTTLADRHFITQNKPSAHVSSKLKDTNVDWFNVGIYMQ